MRNFFLFIPALLLAVCTSSCYKDPDTIIENIGRVDTLYVQTHDTIFQQVTDTLTLNQFADTVTTFILIRHAETTNVGTNPSLSVAGQARVTGLVRLLKNVSLKGVYTTNYARTMQTAQPVATDKAVSMQTYDPLEPNGLADNLLATYHGEAVLVVGHSNTIPPLLNTLTGTNDYANIPDDQYDNLYVVTVFKKGLATVVHLKYGE